MSRPILPFRRRFWIMLPWVVAPFLVFLVLGVAATDQSPPRWLTYLFAASAVLPGVAALRIEREEARILRWWKAGHCVRCGYDLTGNVSGVCPECGPPPANGG